MTATFANTTKLCSTAPQMAHCILLVEDTNDLAEAMTVILEGEGYSVLHARDGEEALRVLRAGPCPSLIVLDLFMPGMSGIEFRRIQRADPDIADIPVIVVSGVAGMVKEIETMGVVRCFRKPIDFGELLGAVTAPCPAAA